jgi:hypothetical protein
LDAGAAKSIHNKADSALRETARALSRPAFRALHFEFLPSAFRLFHFAFCI